MGLEPVAEETEALTAVSYCFVLGVQDLGFRVWGSGSRV